MQRFREIWWIRHGESLGNAGARTREPGTYSLTQRGFDEAGRLANWFERRPSLIVTSTFTRSRETAAPVIARHCDTPVVEWPVHEISFLAPHRCIDTTQVERRTLAQEFWSRWDPEFADGTGAESFSGFMSRVSDSLDRARHCSEPFVAVFTHAQFMRGIIWRVLNPTAVINSEAMRMFYEFSHGVPVPNCSILPMLIAEDGSAFVGPIHAPIGDAENAATVEHIRLSGL